MGSTKVVLFGSEKMAQLCHFFLTHDSAYEVVAFTIDGRYIKSNALWGLPLVAFEDIQHSYPPDDYAMFIAVGYQKLNTLRADRYREAREKGYEMITYVSSKCNLWGEVTIGDNCFISENTVMNPWAVIGNNVIIRNTVFIGHDASIGDHCWISNHSSINGHVTIEPYCFIGSNTTVRDKVTIRKECLIGAGSVILSDTQEKEVYISKPAELYPLDSARFVQLMNI
jgi:sugar O-acyltransferase (sialic acid O-acetyltransferase NeuD family)